MKKLFLFLLAGTFLFASCNSNGTQTGDNTTTENQPKEEILAKPVAPKAEGTVRILFVGNSHTEYFASFPKIMEALCKENGKQVEVHTLITMGASIDEILSDNKAKAEKMFAQTDKDSNYFDFVILQEKTPVAIDEEAKYINNCKAIHEMIAKNSPGVATYIYELASPGEYNSNEYKEYRSALVDNAIKVAKTLPNTGVIKLGTVIDNAYAGKEGYTAIKDGKDMLRHNDNSKHALNDAVFMNSIVLYQTLFGETPKIPQQLPLATGTGDNDGIKNLDVATAISNASALEKIAASHK